MSMELLKEAIKIVDADDGVRSTANIRKPIKPSRKERDRQQLVAAATTSEYDPESDNIIVNSSAQRRNVMNHNKKLAKNISLLEECRLQRKANVLKRNIKYMIYERNCKLDPGKTEEMINFMNERSRCRKKILHALRKQNNGVRDYGRNFRKSKNKSIFTDEDFMKIATGPERIKLLRAKNKKGRNQLDKQKSV